MAEQGAKSLGPKVGLTTTIPVEVVLAAGLVPVDLNNLFIGNLLAYQQVSQAEAEGLPRTICAWVKGIYATLMAHPEITGVIVSCQGDCSYSQALGEILAAMGLSVIHFKYPYPKDRQELRREIAKFRARLGVSAEEVAKVHRLLQPVRQALSHLDRLTWETGQVRGRENFQFLIASSDFGSDPVAYYQKLTAFLQEAQTRPHRHPPVRLGIIGIPPIFLDLWDYLEELPAEVVFNEMPRQFSMPYPFGNLVEQYLAYTYPYEITGRLADIKAAIQERRLDGLIHYTQSFCFRQMFDQMFREKLALPILTIEGDRPTVLDSRTRMRLEAFIDVLRP